MAQDSSKTLFARVPRTRRLGAAIAVGTWLVLSVAFLADVASAPRGAEWLYGVEARRAEYARAFAAEQAAQRADAEERARHASRAAPAPSHAHVAALPRADAVAPLPSPAARASAGLCSILTGAASAR